MTERLRIRPLKVVSDTGIFLLLLFSLAFAKSNAQDAQFSMPEYAPLLVNPAQVGEVGRYRAHFNYSSQWKSLGAAFQTLAGSFDMHIGKSMNQQLRNASGLGAGIVFMTDKAGATGVKLTSVNAQVAYRVKVSSSSSLGGGLNVGFAQRSFNPSDSKWGTQFNGVAYDPTLPSLETGLSDSDAHLDLGAGVVFRFARSAKKRKRKIGPEMEIGAAAYHLGRIKLSQSETLSEELKARFTGFIDLQLPIGAKIAICPAFYGNSQNSGFTYLAGANIKYLLIADDTFIGEEKALSLEAGGFLRNSNSFLIDALVNWGAYSIGLAYRFDYSGLKPYSSGRGGFELNLRWIAGGEG